MMKKKMVALLLSLVMLFSLVPVTAVADGSNLSMTVTYPEGRTADTLQEGDAVTLSVSNNDMTVSTFTFNVSFDKEKFECVSIVGTGKNPNKYYLTDSYGDTVAAQASSDVSGANSTGSVGFGWSASEDAAYVAGKIVTITFEAKDIGSANFTLNEDSSGQDGFKNTVSTASVTVLKTPVAAASATVDAPTKGNAFPTSVTIPENAAYSASVAWFTDADCTTSAGNIALGGQTYYAQITLTPDKDNGESFASSVAVTGSATGDYTPTSGNLVLTVPFTTPQREITDIAVYQAQISYEVGDELNTESMKVRAIYDDGTTDEDYKAYTVSVDSPLTADSTTATITSKDNTKISKNLTFTVRKKTLPTNSISITPTELNYNGEDQKGNVTVVIKDIATELTGTLNVIYKISDQVVNVIKDVGTYDVYVSTEGGTMYNPLEQTKVGTVTISQADNSISNLTIDGWTYGEQAKDPSATAAFGTVAYTYSNAENGAFTPDVPTDAGTWYVKASVAETTNYKGAEAVTSFIIAPKAVTVTADNASKVYNTADPTLSATVTGLLGSDTITYTVSRAPGSDVGTYTITPAGDATQGNYNVSYVTGTFTISQADNSISGLTMEGWTYGENAKAPSATAAFGTVAYTYSNAENGTFTSDVPTDAGTWYVKATVAETTNYKGAEAVTSFIIAPKTVDVSALTWDYTQAMTYNGAEQIVTLAGQLPEGVTAVYSNNTMQFVGDYEAGVTLSPENGNYQVTGSVANLNWSIVAAAQNPTVEASRSLAKGGNTLDLTTLVSGNQGDLSFEIVSGGEYATLSGTTLTSGTTTGSVVITVKAAAKNDGGDSKVEYSAYVGESAITVTVVDKEQKELTVTMGGWTYGDNAKSPAFTAPAGSAAPAITYTGKNYTSNEVPADAGTYTVQVVCETATEIHTGTAEFTIAPRTAAITWSNTSFTYDGQSHVPTATVSNKVGQDSVSVTVSGAATAAGNYTATATGLDNANYVLPATAPTRTFTIAKRTAELNWSNTTFTYDGQSHVPTATVTNAAEGDTVTVTVTGEKTNAGSYTATAAGLSNSNYALPNAKTQSFTINKRVAELNWSNTSFTYDGKSHQPTATVTNAVDGDTVTVTVSGGKTNAGSYTATATKVSNSNYALSDGAACDFTIASKNISDMTVNLSAAALTYNGKAQTKAVASVKDGNTTLSSSRDYTVSGATQTNAGHYELTVTGTGNYTGSKTVAWEIAPKAVTVTANNATKVFGAEDPALTAKVSGTVGGDTVAYTVKRAEGNDVGTYAITPAGAENQGNYTVTFKNGTFTITKANASVTSAPQAVTDLMFNGQARDLVTAGKAEGGELQYKLGNGAYGTAIPTATEAGTYSVYYKVVGDANHNNVSEARITVTIAPLSGNDVVTDGDVTASTQPDDTINNQLSGLEQFTDEAVGIQEGDSDAVKQEKRETAVKNALVSAAGTSAANASALYYVDAGSSAAKVTFALPASAATHNFKVMYMAANGAISQVTDAKVTASGIEVPVAADGDGVYLVTYTNKPIPVIIHDDDTVKSAGTGDMGLVLYTVLAVSGATGAAWLGLKKRKEN